MRSPNSCLRIFRFSRLFVVVGGGGRLSGDRENSLDSRYLAPCFFSSSAITPSTSVLVKLDASSADDVPSVSLRDVYCVRVAAFSVSPRLRQRGVLSGALNVRLSDGRHSLRARGEGEGGAAEAAGVEGERERGEDGGEESEESDASESMEMVTVLELRFGFLSLEEVGGDEEEGSRGDEEEESSSTELSFTTLLPVARGLDEES
jgi:hypothetical protein